MELFQHLVPSIQVTVPYMRELLIVLASAAAIYLLYLYLNAANAWKVGNGISSLSNTLDKARLDVRDRWEYEHGIITKEEYIKRTKARR